MTGGADAGGRVDRTAGGALALLAVPGATFEVRVRPGARQNRLSETERGLMAEVTTAPERGRANDAVGALLAKSLGVAPSRLELVRGQKARIKVFRLKP